MYHCFLSMFTHRLSCLCRVTICLTYSHWYSFEIENTYDIVFLKFTFDFYYTNGKNTYSFIRSQYFCGLLINMYLSFGESFTVGYPFFYA